MKVFDWIFLTVIFIAVLMLIVALTFIVSSSDVRWKRDDFWEKQLIEKGHGTYKDGKFEWKDQP